MLFLERVKIVQREETLSKQVRIKAKKNQKKREKEKKGVCYGGENGGKKEEKGKGERNWLHGTRFS